MADMDIVYKNKALERNLILLNITATSIVVITALAQLGFYRPILPDKIMYAILIAAAILFVADKFIRFFNARSKKDCLKTFWFEFLSIPVLAVLYYTSGLLWALGVYLLLQIITKVCRTVINLAASGKSPALTFVGSFIAIIFIGSILLMLPKSHTTASMSYIDALFTSTSATCVTGLTVKDTGADFTFIGQIIILCMIQLGGLGIIVFGAVFALLLGQALGMRQAAAMQDLLSERTSNMITHFIGFIFIFTISFEALGAILLHNMWLKAAPLPAHIESLWFCSIFHSISSFCNAGFGLFSDNLIRYNSNWQVYAVICPLIILGGLGFSVLHNLIDYSWDKLKLFIYSKKTHFSLAAPEKIQLQTKIVLLATVILIIAGMAGLLILQNNTGSGHFAVRDAFFQSVTARTAGFNTVNINSFSPPSKLLLMILMFIGGSPGGSAGGIKTVTIAVIIMAVYSAARKRNEVEIFKRSVPLSIVGRALTVISMFTLMFFTAAFLLTITERHSNLEFSSIMFEASSALGTVGLSCGITPALTTAGKIIIIITMLVGRLGPLTLLTLLTFNIKSARFNYPTQAVVVG